ncbi:MAG: hypothetical protein IMF01_04775, partial [Proteobacteria bacterium]|nr:hypothetical protein [Pseudomonadota bacterium]
SIADQKSAKETFARILTLYLIVGSFVFLLVSLLAPSVLTLEFYGKAIITPAYADGLRIIPYILLAYLFQGVYVNLVVGMYLEKKTHLAPLFTGAGMLINLSVNIFLMGYMGFDFTSAGIAVLVSYLGQSFLLYKASKRFYPIRYELNKIARLGIIVAVLFFLPGLYAEGHIYLSLIAVLAYFPMLSAFQVLGFGQIKTAATRLLSRS